MITPNEIREKASRLFDASVEAWIAHETDSYFPYRVRCDLKLGRDLNKTKSEIRSLRSQSKSAIGYGYRLEETEIASRSLGRDRFPTAVYIDSIADLMCLVKRQDDFQLLKSNIELIRQRLPLLSSWIVDAWKKLLPRGQEVKDLVSVVEWMLKNPRPGIHTREVPLAISTKLIERHESILSEWLDRLLPVHAIDCGFGVSDFEKRYGFRYSDSHISIRVLDEQLAEELRLPSSELMLPVEALQRMDVRNVCVVISENKASLDIVPKNARTITMGGLGNGIQMVTSIEWLREARVLYWGDCDVAGFGILSRLRERLPNVVSVMMDSETIDSYIAIAIPDKTNSIVAKENLTTDEQATLSSLINSGVRLEQEKLPAYFVNNNLNHAYAAMSAVLNNIT
jgi:hypothetical protein